MAMGVDVVSRSAIRGPEAGTATLTVDGQPRELLIEPQLSLLEADGHEDGLD
jgi:hypothetical protein